MVFIYNINEINIGEKLKYYRKLANKSLADVANFLCKSKATISKYENNQIIPDAITLIELCNCLNIDVSEFFPFNEDASNSKMLFNPFETNKLFMYYYTDNKLMTSILELFAKNNIYNCKLFNGVKNTKNYNYCSYFYEGTFEANRTTAYFSLQNASHRNNLLEKVQIVVNIPWSDNIEVCKGLILGLTPNSLPIVKKIILSTSELENVTKYNNALKFSKDDVNKIYSDGALIIENKNYDEFFFD